MRILLHILTRPDDELVNQVIEQQESDPNHVVRRMELTKTNPDYDQLLSEIFQADSIHVW